MSPFDAENTNYLWAQLLFEEWKRLGLRHAIVCPGSRSSPLSIAAARTAGLHVTVATDERCAGFIALGVARSSGAPAAVVTTSGTAVANLLPAAVEASMRRTPILLVTADRPPELRECGANQAITQPGIFGVYARWSFDMPCPTSEIESTFVLSIADEAWRRATDSMTGGPVHINCMLREPLAPTRGDVRASMSSALTAWAAGADPWRAAPVGAEISATSATIAMPAIEGGRVRGLIVCGDTDEHGGIGSTIAQWAHLSGWPILADCGADVRYAKPPLLVASADAALAGVAGTALGEALVPDIVLRVGGAVSSKRIQQLVARAGCVISVRHRGQRFDDRHQARVELDEHTYDEALELLLVELAKRRDDSYAARWIAVGAGADGAIDRALSNDNELTEPWLARALCRARAGHHRLVVGNSMPVRDVDSFLPSDALPNRISVNRGASGIDGLVSTAVGHAIGTPTMPVTLLLGDLALLHDLGGLANVRRAPTPLHIVVINNDGGGIFHFLPIADDASASPHFETLFGTPHGFSFEHAAAMFSLNYRRVTAKSGATSALAELATATRPMLIECVTDRRTNVAAHRAVQAAVAAALVKEFS
ncbi:MAG: 2-succinyl-5-enolpyruvyl-6-hydroxy-3-cyclohexene-1-carboxylic-acid synthase [Phycisphaerae bacterium]|nr:2-succinyl-5-enolpyruvyl-6-hydroxy-3-cyclohexene-1-carboxylic-acid synthase [Phycisphaerae bacterium]